MQLSAIISSEEYGFETLGLVQYLGTRVLLNCWIETSGLMARHLKSYLLDDEAFGSKHVWTGANDVG